MRKVLFITTLLLLSFSFSVWAADISGNWTLKMAGRQGDISMDLAVKAAGENITVTAKHPTLGDMAGTGTLKANNIDMTLTSTGERKMGIQFKGTVTGNKMSGTREFIRSAGAQGGAPGGGQGGAPAGGGQGGAPAGGGQGGAPAGGQGGAPAGGGQGGAPAGGQGGAPAGGGQGGAPAGGQGGGQAMSNDWTAEKK
jgi:hypothetical protein